MSYTGCRQFLERHRLLVDQYDPSEILSAFLAEMSKGLAGEQSSLAMIPSYIPPPNRPPRNLSVIAADAGGTHFRTSLIRFDESSTPRFDYYSSHTMPGADGELSREQFFDRIADYLQPVLGVSDRFAFCFSYAAVIDRRRDGRLLYWSKEIQAPEVVGEKVLANLEPALRRRGLPCPARSLILNDTVAALLAGCASTAFAAGLHYVGFILGTGTNTAYFEDNRNILKEADLDPAGSMAVNCESANFDRLERGDIDLELDHDTDYPGRYVLEKMVSGAYLGWLCRLVLLRAACEGVLSSSAGLRLAAMPTLGAETLGWILAGTDAGGEVCSGLPDPDRRAIQEVVDAVVERAALFTAIHMAAALLRSTGLAARAGSPAPNEPPRRACLSADGSVYFRLPTFRERAERRLRGILAPHGIQYSIVHVEEATLIGTAVAGLGS